MIIDGSFLFDFARKLYAFYAFNPKTGEAKIPMRYLLELTYNCNLRCPFCYITADRHKNELTTQEWFSVINQLPRFSFITLCAGEVILKKDFIKIYEKCSKKFRKGSLITNGLALNEELIESLIKNKLFLLSVSLDGYEKNHDINRNYDGLWNKVINNIELFNEKRHKKTFPMLDIKTCVFESNLDDLPKLYKKAISMNAQFFSLTFLRKQPLRQNSKLWNDFSEIFYKEEYPVELYFDLEHFIEIYKELESIAKKSKTTLRYAPRFNSIGDSEKIKRVFNSQGKKITELYNPCQIPMTSIYITPEGDVYPCLSYKVGSLREMTLKEVINTPKFKCFRKNLYYSKIFTGCQMCCDLIPKNQ
ncbi:MAG: radical SAM protein [Candidatus Gastranaerophilales bacterium]|nr:radical SAM protein [Candidatus Gastranaerophilales bacterium]